MTVEDAVIASDRDQIMDDSIDIERRARRIACRSKKPKLERNGSVANGCAPEHGKWPMSGTIQIFIKGNVFVTELRGLQNRVI
ncbi:MAG: hypothetical protein ACI4XG_08205 [Bradyrhizobium sp.]